MDVVGTTVSGNLLVEMTSDEYHDILNISHMFVPRQFRMIRKSKGLKLKDVSRATGLSVQFLSEVERGVRNPSIESYQKIKAFLD